MQISRWAPAGWLDRRGGGCIEQAVDSLGTPLGLQGDRQQPRRRAIQEATRQDNNDGGGGGGGGGGAGIGDDGDAGDNDDE